MPDIIVKNQTELNAAIKSAKGGDTILLAAGTYTSISMSNVNAASEITIKSQDANNRAVVGTVSVSTSSNITLKDFNVIRQTTPTTDREIANRIASSSNITIDGVTFSGGTGDPSNAMGIGLSIRGGTNNKLINSSIDHFVIGFAGQNVDGLLVQGNYIHDNRMDHTNFAEMTNVTINDNKFEALYPINGEHPDAIQFFTNTMSKGNTNVTISNNVVLQGDGRATQGIFMGEETMKMPYTNVKITNNLVYLSGMYHGISLLNATGVTIDSNTVLSLPDDKSTWIRVENVSGSVTNNVTDQIVVAGTSNVTTSRNIELGNDPVTLRSIADISKGSKATVYGLMVDGIGYAPVAGSKMAATVAAQRAAVLAQGPTGPKLLLDLNFGAQGVLDNSTWSTDDPVKPLATGQINNGMLDVSTGSGMELGRGTSRQLFGLSAFTLNFDLKRAGVTAPAGQIMGIFKSWNIALRADGELVFTMTNDAGVTSTLTTSGAKITDTNLHKIALSYQAGGTSTLYVDGKAVGSAKMSGSTRKQESWGLYIGNPFGAAVTGSVGDIEMRDTAFNASQILALNAGSTNATRPATAADTLKIMVAKGVADSAAALAGSTAWGGAMASPATLSLTSAFGTSGASASPLATALATASANGSLYTSASPFSMLTTPRLASLDLYHS